MVHNLFELLKGPNIQMAGRQDHHTGTQCWTPTNISLGSLINPEKGTVQMQLLRTCTPNVIPKAAGSMCLKRLLITRLPVRVCMEKMLTRLQKRDRKSLNKLQKGTSFCSNSMAIKPSGWIHKLWRIPTQLKLPSLQWLINLTRNLLLLGGCTMHSDTRSGLSQRQRVAVGRLPISVASDFSTLLRRHLRSIVRATWIIGARPLQRRTRE